MAEAELEQQTQREQGESEKRGVGRQRPARADFIL